MTVPLAILSPLLASAPFDCSTNIQNTNANATAKIVKPLEFPVALYLVLAYSNKSRCEVHLITKTINFAVDEIS